MSVIITLVVQTGDPNFHKKLAAFVAENAAEISQLFIEKNPDEQPSEGIMIIASIGNLHSNAITNNLSPQHSDIIVSSQDRGFADINFLVEKADAHGKPVVITSINTKPCQNFLSTKKIPIPAQCKNIKNNWSAGKIRKK